MVKLFPLLLLLCFPVLASAQITVPDEVPRDTPIIAGCNCVTPEGAEIRIRWNLTPDPRGKAEMVPVGNAVHVWAGPGTHRLSASVVWMQFEEVEIPLPDGGSRTIRNLLAWDLQSYDKAFTVPGSPGPGPEPDPGPNPGPDPDPNPPSGFEDTIRQTLSDIGNPPSRTKVADIYGQIAEEANTRRDIWKPAMMVDEAKTRVASNLTPEELRVWLPFWPKMNDAFRSLNLEESDTDGFIEAFRNFSTILKG